MITIPVWMMFSMKSVIVISMGMYLRLIDSRTLSSSIYISSRRCSFARSASMIFQWHRSWNIRETVDFPHPMPPVNAIIFKGNDLRARQIHFIRVQKGKRKLYSGSEEIFSLVFRVKNEKKQKLIRNLNQTVLYCTLPASLFQDNARNFFWFFHIFCLCRKENANEYNWESEKNRRRKLVASGRNFLYRCLWNSA